MRNSMLKNTKEICFSVTSGSVLQVVELLREGKTVEACLRQQTPSGVLEKLLPKRFKQYKKGVSGAK